MRGTALTITIYGIKNCDTMKKARAWLDDHGVAYDFHDYKTAGIAKDKLKVGAKDVIAVIDETVIGLWTGIRHKFARGVAQAWAKAKAKAKAKAMASTGRGQSHIARKGPANTKWTKAASVRNRKAMKKPAGVKKKPAGNKKSNGIWLWVCVTVGKGNSVWTHSNS